jgi:hypothetical protein
VPCLQVQQILRGELPRNPLQVATIDAAGRCACSRKRSRTVPDPTSCSCRRSDGVKLNVALMVGNFSSP